MSLAFNYPGKIYPWVPECKPWGAPGWHLRTSGIAIVNVETTIASFQTGAHSIFLAHCVLGDVWAGSASGHLIVRARNCALIDQEQYTHDLEQGTQNIPFRFLFPPFSDCQIAFLSFTSTGNPRNFTLFLSGWYGRIGDA